MVKWLVYYCIHRLNIEKQRFDIVPPRVAATGFKPSALKEYALGFGDYCECRDPTAKSNDATQSRSRSCIALMPVGNSQGSWYFLNLATLKVVASTTWKKLMTNLLIIQFMNKLRLAPQAKEKQLKSLPQIVAYPNVTTPANFEQTIKLPQLNQLESQLTSISNAKSVAIAKNMNFPQTTSQEMRERYLFDAENSFPNSENITASHLNKESILNQPTVTIEESKTHNLEVQTASKDAEN